MGLLLEIDMQLYCTIQDAYRSIFTKIISKCLCFYLNYLAHLSIHMVLKTADIKTWQI